MSKSSNGASLREADLNNAAFRHTPWGAAHHATKLGRGIVCVSTASHGGLFVPAELLDQIPADRRADAKRWSGSEQWYEEDCCACYVIVAFPDLFGAGEVANAKHMNELRNM